MAKRILVLDDDLAVLEAIETALVYGDFDVKTIGRTYNILKSIEEFKPDLILLDLMLDGISGGEICKQVKSHPATSRLPVIVISAYQGNKDYLDSIGCDYFISKPFDLADLYKAINRVLQ